jgi:hypothetical protein
MLWLGRHTVHEGVHHLLDMARALGTAPGIRAPMLRAELIDNLRVLGDRAHQERVWVRGEGFDPRWVDDLEYTLDLMFKGSTLAEDPESAIGELLRDDDEAGAIAAVVAAVKVVDARLPSPDSDAEVIVLPEWEAVVAAARTAYDLLVRPSA